MKSGALFREGVEVHIAEGHGFAAYFYLLVLLAPVVFLALFLPALDAQVWIAPAAFFTISSVSAMILTTYFALRLANQEFAPWRFVSLGSRSISPKGTGSPPISICLCCSRRWYSSHCFCRRSTRRFGSPRQPSLLSPRYRR